MFGDRYFVTARQIRNFTAVFIEPDDARVGCVDAGVKAFRSAAFDGHAHQGLTLHQAALRPAVRVPSDVRLGRCHHLTVGFHVARHGCDGDGARFDGQRPVYKADFADKRVVHHSVCIRECQRLQTLSFRVISQRERLDHVRRRIVTRFGDAALDSHVQGPHAVLVVQRKDRFTGVPPAVGQGRAVICLFIGSGCDREFGNCVIIYRDNRLGLRFLFCPLQHDLGITVDQDCTVFDVGLCPVRADGDNGGVILVLLVLYGGLRVIGKRGNTVQHARRHILRPGILKRIWNIKTLRGKADLRILLGNLAAGDF